MLLNMIENLRINLKGEEKERFLETGIIIYIHYQPVN